MARRVIWFEPPEVSLADPVRLVAYAMAKSTREDMDLILQHWPTLETVISIHFLKIPREGSYKHPLRWTL